MLPMQVLFGDSGRACPDTQTLPDWSETGSAGGSEGVQELQRAVCSVPCAHCSVRLGPGRARRALDTRGLPCGLRAGTRTDSAFSTEN